MRAAVLGVVLAMAPAGAWAEEAISSKTWRTSLESDIRNGRDAAGICSDAKIYASSSTDAPFKDWAYGIANQYCGKAEEPTVIGGDAKPKDPPAAPIPEREQYVNGITVPLCSHGMPCLGRLRQAMGLPLITTPPPVAPTPRRPRD